jgi:hypothetical protein
MAIFEEVSLRWGGEEYKIEPTKVMGAIARVEEVITLKELGEYAQKGDAPMAKLAMAFASVLRYAGARVSDDEVYAGMFGGESQTSALASITVLLQMMIPPSAYKQVAKGNAQAAPTGGKNSSKKPTK